MSKIIGDLKSAGNVGGSVNFTKGDKGDKGVSGVYVGSGEMPEGYNVQVDPEGEATPRMSIGTVETLPEGSNATASIVGTPEEPVLNLGIPQGKQGATVLEDEYANYNRFIESEGTTGVYLNANGVVTKNTAYNMTGYIPCRAGKYVYFSSAIKSPYTFIRGIEFFDGEKNRLSFSAVNDTKQGGSVTVISAKSANYEQTIRCVAPIEDERCRYIRIVYPEDVRSALVIEVRDWYNTDPLDVDYVAGRKIEPPLEKEIPYWRGKTIAWNGDSIPAGYASRAGYPELVELHLSCVTSNHSIGGSTLAVNTEIPKYNADGTDNVDYRHPLVERYGEMEDDADLVCIAIGSNDWCYSHTPFGDMASTGTDTFYGALKTLCEGLLNKYHGKPIVFFTPIKRVVYEYDRWDENKAPIADSGAVKMPYSQVNEYGKTLADYANAIKEVCCYYGIPVLDLYNECLINPLVYNIKTSCFPLNNEVYVRVENGVETELTKEQANKYTGTGEIVVTSRRDGTHPNIHGHKILARRITGYIKQLADGVF